MQIHSDHETPKIKLCSVRALKQYFNKKNLTHGRETATISKFDALIYLKRISLKTHVELNYQNLNFERKIREAAYSLSKNSQKDPHSYSKIPKKGPHLSRKIQE